MDAFYQWIIQIILFLIFVSVIDLLIPKNNFQKYIRLVIGIIFILIFLKPLFSLLQTDFNQVIETSIDQLDEQGETTEFFHSSINTQKKDIQASQHAYILKQMATQLIDLANPSFKEQFQLEIHQIEFTFIDEKELDYDHLNEVIVYVKELRDGGDVVKEIDEIVIFPESPTKSHQTIEDDEMKGFLGELWGIDQQKISIHQGGGTN